MRESRLFKIIYHLLDKGRATAPELARQLEVSVRTIYRDIDVLSSNGIPVYTEPGRDGGIYLMDNFVLDRTVFSEQEKQEILTALQSVHATPNTENTLILQKLSALFQVHADDYPLKLAYKGQAWYLKSYCTAKQDFRLFKLNRIMHLELLEETFTCAPFPKHLENSSFAPEQAVTLCFPGEMAYRVYDEFDLEQVTLQTNGTLFVSAKMPVDNWLVSFLLSFGPNVTVLSPAHLKQELARQAKLTYEKAVSENKP